MSGIHRSQLPGSGRVTLPHHLHEKLPAETQLHQNIALSDDTPPIDEAAPASSDRTSQEHRRGDGAPLPGKDRGSRARRSRPGRLCNLPSCRAADPDFLLRLGLSRQAKVLDLNEPLVRDGPASGPRCPSPVFPGFCVVERPSKINLRPSPDPVIELSGCVTRVGRKK